MWVTQTYLGSVEPDADVFIYYLYEDYVRDQQAFTTRLQQRLEELGEIFGGKACLQMPSPRYAGKVEAEVRENRALWEALHSRLPGLLLTTAPLTRITSYDQSCFFVPFETHDFAGVDAAVAQIKTLADESITWAYKEQNDREKSGFMDRFLDSIELKPGVAGIRLDVRKLFRR